MTRSRDLRQRRTHRRGAVLVECALVLPVILILLIGSIEVGGAIVTRHKLSQAARAGARLYSLKKKCTEVDVHAAIGKIMEDAKLKNYTVTLDPDPSAEVAQLTPLTVTVSIPSNSCSWMPSPWFTKNTVIAAHCVMPADLGEAVTDTSNNGSTGTGSPAPGVFDTDATAEGSGISDKELDKLQKEAQKLKEEAEKAQDKSDKEAAKAAEAQQKATEAQQKANMDGTKKSQDAADKAQKDAAKAATKASAEAQKAAEAWQAADAAAAQVKLYSMTSFTIIQVASL